MRESHPPGARARLDLTILRLIPLGLLFVGLCAPWDQGTLACHGPVQVLSGWMLLVLLVALSGGLLAIPIGALLLPWVLRLVFPRSVGILWVYRVALLILLLLLLAFGWARLNEERGESLEVTWGLWVCLLATVLAAVIELAAASSGRIWPRTARGSS